MFGQLENIDSAYKKIRVFCIITIIAVVLMGCFCFYLSFAFVRNNEKRIYILANGKALEAIAGDRKDNVPVEARDHIKTFHELFFTLDPDDSQQKAGLTKALYLADETAKREFDNLTEQNYYANIISSNISQTISTDSIHVDLNTYPYYFKFYGKEKIVRSTAITTRSLITEGYLRNIQRSDNNSHGFLIERWTTVENKDLTSVNR